MNPEQFVSRYPQLFHITTPGSWSSIRERGLFSASTALEHFGLLGSVRIPFESRYRATDMHLFEGDASDIVLHDQTRMPRHHLLRSLKGTSLSPEDWYRLVNARVFFWPTADRLQRALRLPSHRRRVHDVLVIDSRGLIDAYGPSVELLFISAGDTHLFPQPRNRASFVSLAAYAASVQGRPLPSVVEVAIEDSVPDIARYVTEVRRMRGNKGISAFRA